MQLDFVSRAILAGMGIALVAGPLGSFIVWRRMANFGDTLAHSTLLGVCFALLLSINLYIGLFSICIIVAALLSLFSKQRRLANDTILGMLAYTTLALGLIIATFLEGVRVDLLGYLYGDILAVNEIDLIWILCVDILVLIALMVLWRPLLSVTVHEDLARVEGAPVTTAKWAFMIMLAIVFAISMKLVGILLITALLIIPASAARQISRTPEQMAIFASIIGMIAVAAGVMVSNTWDWPTGPAIVVVSTGIFALNLLVGCIRKV